MRVLALDPALTTGLAYANTATGEEIFQSVDFHDSHRRSPGDAYAELADFLSGLLHRVDVVVIEEPTPRNMSSAKVQYGFIAIIEAVCARFDAQYVLYNVSTIRAWLTRWIHANLSVDELAELAIIYEHEKDGKRKALMRHHHIYGAAADHNIADASALLGLALTELKPCSKSLPATATGDGWSESTTNGTSPAKKSSTGRTSRKKASASS